MSSDRPSLLRQIAELRREAMWRERTYPTLVSRREMRKGEADYQLESLWAAVATLEWCHRNADLLRRVAAEAKAAAQTPEETMA